MPYAFQTLAFNKPGTSRIDNTTDLGLPATHPCALLSMWTTFALGGLQFVPITVLDTGVLTGFAVVANPGAVSGATVSVQVYNASDQQVMFGISNFTFSGSFSMHHVLVSLDTMNHLVQVYVNDAPNTWTAPYPQWTRTQPIPRPTSGYTAAFVGGGGSSCIGDIWWTDQTTFTDLSIVANRRKFINADLTPVDLGSNGEIPFGTPPRVFLSCAPGGAATDFTANAGTGGSFAPALSFGSCEVYPVGDTPPPPPSSLAMDNLLVSGGPKTSELIFLDWSDDRAHTWSNPVGQLIGARGAYLTSVSWSRLGYARDRTFRLTWSVPVKTALQGAWIDADTSAKS